VQEKISLRLENGRLVPTEKDGQCLLKPIPSMAGLDFREEVPANEHLTMQLAAQAFGIETPPNGIVFFKDGSPAYVVKRFDRDPLTGEKRPQEDFSQGATAFPIRCFQHIGSRRYAAIGPRRWRSLGLARFLRYWIERQSDAAGTLRAVWVFELLPHFGVCKPTPNCMVNHGKRR
jgi:hypothetical protein